MCRGLMVPGCATQAGMLLATWLSCWPSAPAGGSAQDRWTLICGLPSPLQASGLRLGAGSRIPGHEMSVLPQPLAAAEEPEERQDQTEVPPKTQADPQESEL